MKASSKIFALIALATLAVACEKEKEIGTVTPAEPTDPNTVVFTANLPTRTTIDANDQVVSWAAGDEVKFVWNGGSTTASAASAGPSTTFTVEVGEGITELYAVYPASAGGSYNDGKVTVHYSGAREDGSYPGHRHPTR